MGSKGKGKAQDTGSGDEGAEQDCKCVYSRLDHVRNETVRERLRLEPVLKKVEMRRECCKLPIYTRVHNITGNRYKFA